MRLKIIAIISIVAIAFTVIAAMGNNSTFGKKLSPEEVCNLFLDAMARMDFAEMRYYSTQETESGINLLEYMVSNMNESELSEVKADFNYGKVKECIVQDNKDIVECTTCCDANAKPGNVMLFKINGKWLVYMPKN
jgi:hypothetical protein